MIETRAPAPLFVDRIREHARTIPDALAVRAADGDLAPAELTMAELAGRAERIAARLREEGCRPGDRVVVLGKPSLAWFEVMVGAMFARCAFTPLSTALTVAEQQTLIADAAPRLVFADAGLAAQGGCPAGETVLLEGLAQWLAAGPGAGEPDCPQGADLFSIIYSSGTTGVPKGIAHTASGRAEFIHARPRPGFGPGRIGYVCTSHYANFGFLGMLTPLYFGAAVSLAPRFTVEGFLRACEEEGVTEASLVPVQIRRIFDDPGYAPNRLASLHFTMISGSPMDPALKQRLVAEWPGRIVDSYGTTETGGIATLDLKAFPDRLDSVGRIMDGVEVSILDEDGNPLPPGSIGEIAAITPMPMEGYYNQPELTARSSLHDQANRRIIRTGDVGRIDDQGFLFITGRTKDMIISGGLNIFASDIEAALDSHPAVAESAVIAVPDDRWGECPHAIVALREGCVASPDALLDWARGRLARTHWPVAVDIVGALPRNDMGKVLKRVLREPFWANRDREVA